MTTNNEGQKYYHLVESYREHGRTRQRTLLSLGRVGEDKLDHLASAIAKHKDIITIMDLAKSISIDKTYILGPLLLLRRLFETTGINVAIERIQKDHPKLEIGLKKIIFSMVACRFVKPSSKLQIYEHWIKLLHPEMVCQDLKLHQMYRVIDLMATYKDQIEKDLYWHDRDLLNQEVDVVLYDLTTLRFESTREDLGNLRRFGYSKEMRTDCTQVVLGLLLDLDGIPLGFEVYPGNTFEGKTLSDIVDKIQKKFHVRRFIFVGDRGLFSNQNLSYMRSQEIPHQYILGMRLGVFRQRHDEFYDLRRFKFINESLAVYETEHEGDRCIITWSRSRADRDRKTREDILNKIRKKLLLHKGVSAKSFVSNQNYQKYLTGLNEGHPRLNEKMIETEAGRDGFFGIITNVKNMGAEELVFNYKRLWIIEDAFGEIKGNLKARPIFHWTDTRIVGHLTLCFLSYLCEAHITRAFRRQNLKRQSEKPHLSRPLTVFDVMKDLNEVRSVPVQVKDKKMWVRTDICGNAAHAFGALGVKIPSKVLSLS